MDKKFLLISTWAAITVLVLAYADQFFAGHPVLATLTIIGLGAWGMSLYNGGANSYVANAAGATLTYARAMLDAFVIAVLAYLAVSILFGINPGGYEQSGGMVSAARNGSMEALKAVAMFAIVLSVFRLRLMAVGEPKPWVYRTTIAVALGFLVYQGADVAGKLNRSEEWQLSKTAVTRWVDANSMAAAWSINQSAEKTAALSFTPQVVVIPRLVDPFGNPFKIPIYKMLVDENGNQTGLGESEVAEVGSQWLVYFNERQPGQVSDTDYLRMVNRWDERKVRFMRVDLMADIIKNQPEGPMVRKAPPVQEVPAVAYAAEVLPQPKPLEALEPSVEPEYQLDYHYGLMQNNVFVQFNEWTDTGIFTEDGDVVDVRAADGTLLPVGPLSQLSVRSGYADINKFHINEPEDNGFGYGLTKTKGHNVVVMAADGGLTKYPLRLKLDVPVEGNGMWVLVTRILQPNVQDYMDSLPRNK